MEVAGFGVTLDELITMGFGLVLALFVVQVVLAPGNQDIFSVMQDKVFGWPTCTGTICVLPSQNSLDLVFGGFTSFYEDFPASLTRLDLLDPFAYFNFLLAVIDIIKGVVGGIVTLILILRGNELWQGYNYYHMNS